MSSGKFLVFFQLVTQFTHVLYIIEPQTENRNSSLKKPVLILRAQICGKIKKLKTWKHNFFSNSYYGHIRQYVPQSETTLTKQFFSKLKYFFFLSLGQYCPETGVNSVANCVTPKFTPLRSKFWIFSKFQFRLVLSFFCFYF